MPKNWIIFETSSRVGRIGLATAGRIVAEAKLDETRRHARDLASTTEQLLSEAGLKPASIHGVMVSAGPGSFTGLRVGIMAAKAFAYATGCKLVAVPTFDAIVEQAERQSNDIDVIADALQKMIYVRRYRHIENRFVPVNDLKIEPLEQWLESLPADLQITGPGVDVYRDLFPAEIKYQMNRLPTIQSVFNAGKILEPLSRNEIANLEPIYLRGSSAEEKAKLAMQS